MRPRNKWKYSLFFWSLQTLKCSSCWGQEGGMRQLLKRSQEFQILPCIPLWFCQSLLFPFPKEIFLCFAECLLCHNVDQRSCFLLGRLTLCNYCRGNLVSPSWILAQFHFLSENKRRISVHLFCIDTHIQTYTLRYIVHAQKTLGGVHD